MATELGKAYVQIIPSAKGISGSISSALGGEATSAGKSAGLNIAGAIKGAIAAAGIGTAIKSALEAGGNLQQSFGGLDTLYGDAAESAKQYAAEAAKAGISANSYAEQAVSFGAALKSAFGGDTVKAAEAANTAILDMADNSAKMGTDIGAIQNAYQGFAKQNYTMLDNLKLGYGGTKTEMQRLLADAEKLSGVKYDMDNLGDVYQAIHVIQEDLGLTGVAAEEASTTFTGSFGAMKASAENLLANLALGEDISDSLDDLGKTFNTFLFNNLVPMVGNLLNALPDLLSGVGSILIQSLNIIGNNSDEIVAQGIAIVTSLVEAIVSAAPYLVEAALRIAMSLGEALINTDWVTIGTDLMNSLKDSIDLAAGELLGMDTGTIDSFIAGITAGLPQLLAEGVEFITNIANGIMEAMPELILMAGDIIITFAQGIMENLPTIMENGAQLLLNLVNGIINNLPQIAGAVVQIIAKFIATIAQNLPRILMQGIQILGKLVAGLIRAIPQLLGAVGQIITNIVDTFKQYDWKKIGRDILEGIKKGILDAVSSVVEAAKEVASSIWEAVTGFFEISSPSKLMFYAGEMLDEGFADGIVKNRDIVDDAIDNLNSAVESRFNANYNFATPANDNRIDQLLTLLSNYLPEIASGDKVNITLDGDAGRLFRLMQRESIRNTQLAGVNSVLSAT